MIGWNPITYQLTPQKITGGRVRNSMQRIHLLIAFIVFILWVGLTNELLERLVGLHNSIYAMLMMAWLVGSVGVVIWWVQ
jgi:hypothetical protein